mgnify:CR=1 FL=1|tara:strand:+ start:3268 stop:3402 length:135 start_codon:yes stop_codon:yes gene_type:complete
MKNVEFSAFSRDFEFQAAKRQERKQTQEKRSLRRGKRSVWQEKE